MSKYEFKGTPGPWCWYTSNSFNRLGTEGGYNVLLYAVVYNDGVAGIGWKNEADARLIAACPVLLKALMPFADHADDRCADSPEWDSHNSVTITVTIGDLRAARAAISRALGEDE